MAATNHERVNKALELLRSGLAPLCAARSHGQSQGLARCAWTTIRRFAEDPKLAERPIGDWDAAALLKLMWDTWNDVFP